MPRVLIDAPEIWRPPVPLPEEGDSCTLTCFQAVQQCQSFWCWAAILQEAFRCLQSRMLSQCQVAEMVLSPETCACDELGEPCDTSRHSPCNRPQFLDVLLGRHLSRPAVLQNLSTFSRAALCAELATGDPVFALFSAPSNHYVVLSGASRVGGHDFLELLDPEGGGKVGQIDFDDPRRVRYNERVMSNVFFI